MTHPLMIVIICAKYKKNPSRTANAMERTWFSKSRSNYHDDIGQGQRSSHATHLLMLVIICTKYGKTPSGTVDATERTRFSRPRPNDLENIGRGHYMQHTLSMSGLLSAEIFINTDRGKQPFSAGRVSGGCPRNAFDELQFRFKDTFF